MTKDKKDSADLTRIEDLSDFLHDDSEEVSLLEDNESEADSFDDQDTDGTDSFAYDSTDNFEEDASFEDSVFEEGPSQDESLMDLEKESFGDSTSFIQIPDELDESDTEFSEETDEFGSDFIEDTDEFENESSTNETAVLDLENDETQELIDLTDLEQVAKTSIPEQESIKEHKIDPPKDYVRPDDLRDINEFAEVNTGTDLSIEGNPPFSIIVSNIKYVEDTDQILEILIEHKIVKPEHESDAAASLRRGQILIPRLSEYCAVVLCHKLRQFNINLKMGLSYELQNSSTFEDSDKGLITRSNIRANVKSFEDLVNKSTSVNDIQVTTNNSFDNYDVIKNITVKSRTQIVPNDQLNSEEFDSIYSQVQEQLIDQLKQDALDLKGNALLNVAITLITKNETTTNFVCTANVALVVKKQ